MKLRSIFVCSALCVIGATIFGLATWSAAVVAQDDPQPVRATPIDEPISDNATANNQGTTPPPIQPVPTANLPGSQPTNAGPFLVQQGQSTPYAVSQYPATQPPSSGTPMGIPGPPHIPQYYSYYTLRQPGGSALRSATVLDRRDTKSLELSKQYQDQQNEINKLLKKMAESKDDDEQKKLRSEIVAVTSKQFDLRQQVREREIEQLKERLTEVESTVKKRNELKDKIVEKRVADLLREPDQLSWEPVASNEVRVPGYSYPQPVIAQAVGSTVRRTESTGQTNVIESKSGTTTYAPRTIKRMVMETVEDENGNRRVITRPVEETEYIETRTYQGNGSNNSEPADRVRPRTSKGTSLNDPRFSSRQSSSTNSVTARNNTAHNGPNSSVAEASVRVEFAEAKHKRLVELGDKIKQADVKEAAAELDLAKLLLARAQAEYEATTKLLDLDVRQAEADYEHSISSLEDANRAYKSVSSSATKSKLTTAQAAVEKARIELERAKIKLDLHKKMNNTSLPTPDGEPEEPTKIKRGR